MRKFKVGDILSLDNEGAFKILNVYLDSDIGNGYLYDLRVIESQHHPKEHLYLAQNLSSYAWQKTTIQTNHPHTEIFK